MSSLGTQKVGRELLGSEITYATTTATTAETTESLVSGKRMVDFSVTDAELQTAVTDIGLLSVEESVSTWLGTRQLSSQLLGGTVTEVTTDDAVSAATSAEPVNVQRNGVSATEPTVSGTTTPGIGFSVDKTKTTYLGSHQLGASVLGATVSIVDTIAGGVSAATDVDSLGAYRETFPSIEPQKAVSGVNELQPVSLSPRNITVFYNEEDDEYQTDWFLKETPIESPGELIIVGTFRGTYDPVTVVVERRKGGESKPLVLNSDSHILRVSEDSYGNELVENGAEYRLRFPGYRQADALERLHLALGWNNETTFSQNWDVDPVDIQQEPQKELIAVLLSENYRFDATLDEIFESQHITTANDVSLDYLAKEVGTSRVDEETDKHLRKRVLTKSATRTFSSVGRDVTDLVELIFDDDTEEITLQTTPTEPVLEVLVPQNVIERHVLTGAEIESLMDEAVSSSYNTTVKVI